ncbi:cytochrome b/b6/petD C-terminal domain-like protein [alpha proteobacterium HIMB5]|nr:cytochrome b/b6/petD C-terminal domain-like protein [alpha proteobacterium HIMB5]
MRIFNTISEYGIISKSFHWITAILLFLQIPAGFYLVGLDFGETRITVENYHVIGGILIFYITILRLIYKIFNPTPSLNISLFPGQKLIAKLNHIFLYLTIFTITISGALKKLLGGEKLNIFISKIKIKSNFELAEIFYEVHIFANYTLIALISLHIFAVIIHKIVFKENILKKIT